MTGLRSLKYVFAVGILGIVSASTMQVLASSQMAQTFSIGLVLGVFLGIGTEATANLLTGSVNRR